MANMSSFKALAVFFVVALFSATASAQDSGMAPASSPGMDAGSAFSLPISAAVVCSRGVAAAVPAGCGVAAVVSADCGVAAVGIICDVDWVMPSSVGEQLSGWSFGYSKKERKGLGESKQCEKDRALVLVHCMSGKSRSPAIVIAYLMKSKGWRLAQGYQWVKERR
ncbi:dual specificity protein phosphatase 2-like [Camellia sinensis]|uniref:dual specificity protein phosphatase 2-like n=1 Tax=Camellia sinensis TaxID=4442 RepID=UPI0010357604|nr:dual specificity protein phosphatase 2-like [Camellia sinensis]